MDSGRWANWVRSDGAVVTAIAAFFFLFFYKTGNTFGLEAFGWQTDDGCYLQHLGNYIGIDGANICASDPNFYARGVALLWVVPGLLAKWTAHLLHQNVTMWILPVVALSSYLCWGVALHFVLRILRFYEAKVEGFSSGGWPGLPLFAVFALLNTFSLYYATARGFMAHASEIMLAMGCVHFLLKRELLPALFFAVFLSVTRYNDIPIALLFAGMLLDDKDFFRKSPLKLKVLLGAGTLGLIAFGAWIGLYYGYHAFTLLDALESFQWESVRDFLYSPRWGMLWSGSWWLAALGIGLWRFPKSSNLSRAATIWLALEALLGAIWGGNGSDFAYRYLIGSYAGALLVWLEFLTADRVRQRTFKVWTIANGFWVMMMTFLYQTVPGTTIGWDGRTCVIPARITQNIFESLLNFKAYQIALARNIPPLTLLYSRYPEMMPKDVAIYRIEGPPFLIATVFSVFCVVFLAAFGLAKLASRSRGHQAQKLENQSGA